MKDLFQTNSVANSSISTNSSLANNIPGSSFGSFGSFNFSEIALILNQFAIFWSIGLSFILVADFFFYYRLHGDGNIQREKTGIKSIRSAVFVWLRYLPAWLFFTAGLILPNLTSFLEIVAILLFIIKFWGDLLAITNISDYFPWFNKITGILKKILTIYKAKNKAKK